MTGILGSNLSLLEKANQNGVLRKSQQKIDNKALLHYRYKCLIMVDQNQQGGGPSLVVTVFKMG